ERRREKTTQQRLRLVIGERLARRLVLDELERPEVAGAAEVADDVQLEERRELGAEALLRVGYMLDDALPFHDLEVLQRHRAADGMTTERDPVRVHGRLV